MVDATIRRARMRELACLGRRPSAACAQSPAEATSIGEGLIARPRATSSRPATDRLMASTI